MTEHSVAHDALAHQAEIKIADLAILVNRLAHALQKIKPSHPLIDDAKQYLKRNDLEGSPLRDLSDATEVCRLHAENEALKLALAKANMQAEHFEREWYLRGDEIEALESEAKENARIIGMGAERELALLSEIERSRKSARQRAEIRVDQFPRSAKPASLGPGGCQVLDVAHEIWAAAQLAPSEGIVDGVARIEMLLRSYAKAGEWPCTVNIS